MGAVSSASESHPCQCFFVTEGGRNKAILGVGYVKFYHIFIEIVISPMRFVACLSVRRNSIGTLLPAGNLPPQRCLHLHDNDYRHDDESLMMAMMMMISKMMMLFLNT